jgi:uncharacterized alpha-E superfamily protein
LEALNFYRHRYRGIPTVHNALDLLLLDPEHPRSMRYQIDQMDSDFHRLPYVDKQSRELDEHARAIAVCSSQLRLARLQDLCGPQQPTGQLASLASLLTGAHQALSNAAAAISDLYFENASSPQQLTG